MLRIGSSLKSGQEGVNLNHSSAADSGDPRRVPWWRRVRSGLLLVGLSAALGMVAAVALGVAVVTTFSLLDHALG